MRCLCFILLFLPFVTVKADTVSVAVAANFAKTMEQLAAVFQAQTGHRAQLSFGASGSFVAQIQHGAPFEVFLSADQAKPQALVDNGFGVAEQQFTYALGKLALWSSQAGYIDVEGEILARAPFRYLAIADPKLAPYGSAAVQTLAHLGLLDRLQARFVQGKNIAQTQQFIASGNAELGFVALAQITENGVIKQGSAWLVPTDYYKPIQQDALLLNVGKKNPAAIALMDFLRSETARGFIERAGYALPPPPPIIHAE